MSTISQNVDLAAQEKWPLVSTSWLGCLTGDCPHELANECLQDIPEHLEEIFREVSEDRDKWLGVIKESLHLLDRCVESWGDYAPVPQSNAGQALRDAKVFLETWKKPIGVVQG